MSDSWVPIENDDAISLIGEGIHTGLRKGSDASDAHTIWMMITGSNTTAWSDALRYLIDGLDMMGYKLCKKTDQPTVHRVMLEQGIDRERLKAALDAKDNWGKMIHAFEFLTASSAVLATWPEEGEDGTGR